MAKTETAEQKLLKMIEASGGAQETSDAQQKVSKEHSSLGMIKKCNLVLLVALIGVLAFLANEIFAGMNMMKKDFQYDMVAPVKIDLKNASLIPVVPKLSLYAAQVDRRNIFIPYEEASQIAGASQIGPIAQKTSGLRLVGVAWFESVDTATAMIEDVDKKVTYVLMKGEKIDDITVKTIYADSVQLGYKDEEIILRYDKSQM